MELRVRPLCPIIMRAPSLATASVASVYIVIQLSNFIQYCSMKCLGLRGTCALTSHTEIGARSAQTSGRSTMHATWLSVTLTWINVSRCRTHALAFVLIKKPKQPHSYHPGLRQILPALVLGSSLAIRTFGPVAQHPFKSVIWSRLDVSEPLQNSWVKLDLGLGAC